MNAQVNTKTNQVTIRPERMVCITQKEEAGVHAPERPYTAFQRMMLRVIGTLTARELV